VCDQESYEEADAAGDAEAAALVGPRSRTSRPSHVGSLADCPTGSVRVASAVDRVGSKACRPHVGSGNGAFLPTMPNSSLSGCQRPRLLTRPNRSMISAASARRDPAQTASTPHGFSATTEVCGVRVGSAGSGICEIAREYARRSEKLARSLQNLHRGFDSRRRLRSQHICQIAG
jgi:hypothetical protein